MNICAIHIKKKLCIIDHSIIQTQLNGNELGSARVFSNVFLTDPSPTNQSLRYDKEFTLNMMQWGQGITHDTLRTGGKSGK